MRPPHQPAPWLIAKRGAEAWNDAFNRHDAEALANMYDAKAGTFSNDYWTGTGHDALLAGFRQMVAAGLTEASVKCEHTTQEGDIAVYDGTYALSGKAPDGKDVSATGHWVVVDKNGVILTHFADEQRQPPSR